MSMYVAQGRKINGRPEVRIVSDIHDANGRIIGERCHGWHPEGAATEDGIGINEAYMDRVTCHCDRFIWTFSFEADR